MSQETAKTPSGVSGRMKVENLENPKFGFEVAGIVATLGAQQQAMIGGDEELALYATDEVEMDYRQANVLQNNVQLKAYDGQNPEKDKNEKEDKDVEREDN